jgi:hypothetical protein
MLCNAFVLLLPEQSFAQAAVNLPSLPSIEPFKASGLRRFLLEQEFRLAVAAMVWAY